jgi:hypothetical protein
MIDKLDMMVQVDLGLLFGMKPGDPCPDKECDGSIREITLAWGKEYVDVDARCGSCNENWKLFEKPSYGDVHEQEIKEQEEQERTSPGHIRSNPKPALHGKVQKAVHDDPDEQGGGEDHRETKEGS